MVPLAFVKINFVVGHTYKLDQTCNKISKDATRYDTKYDSPRSRTKVSRDKEFIRC